VGGHQQDRGKDAGFSSGHGLGTVAD
jgi:hypothetical protein